MTSNRKNLGMTLLVLALAIPACTNKKIVPKNSDLPAAGASLVGVNVDWGAFLARHDLLWTQLPKQWYDTICI